MKASDFEQEEEADDQQQQRQQQQQEQAAAAEESQRGEDAEKVDSGRRGKGGAVGGDDSDGINAERDPGAQDLESLLGMFQIYAKPFLFLPYRINYFLALRSESI